MKQLLNSAFVMLPALSGDHWHHRIAQLNALEEGMISTERPLLNSAKKSVKGIPVAQAGYNSGGCLGRRTGSSRSEQPAEAC